MLRTYAHMRKSYGTRWLLSFIATRILKKFGLFTELRLLKYKINRDVRDMFSNEVAHGPFKGMKLSEEVWWSPYDIANKLLGQYEPHVLDKLAALSRTGSCFIDIGAADGYYAIGALKAKWYSTAVCFEISTLGRKVIADNAKINSLEEKVTIEAEASEESIKEAIAKFGPAVVLCDIEGAEFGLFHDGFLKVLKDCSIIIELHDDLTEGNRDRRAELIERAQRYFDVTYLERTTPPIHSFPELAAMSDDSRLLIFSEGRGTRMDWICLSPQPKF